MRDRGRAVEASEEKAYAFSTPYKNLLLKAQEGGAETGSGVRWRRRSGRGGGHSALAGRATAPVSPDSPPAPARSPHGLLHTRRGTRRTSRSRLRGGEDPPLAASLCGGWRRAVRRSPTTRRQCPEGSSTAADQGQAWTWEGSSPMV